MRLLLAFALLLVVAASVASGQRAPGCRNPRGCRDARVVPPAPRLPPGPSRAPTRPLRKQPPAGGRRPLRRPPTTTPLPTKVDSATPPLDESDFDVKPQVGVDGWLAAPKRTIEVDTIQARTEPPAKAAKPGSCDNPKGFGIKCSTRLDQCREDHECPGSTKCCMVGECGYLCVKPKPTESAKKNKEKAGEEEEEVNREDEQEVEVTTSLPEEVGEEEAEEVPVEGKEQVEDSSSTSTADEDPSTVEEDVAKDEEVGNDEGEEEDIEVTTTAPTDEEEATEAPKEEGA